jgi:hypothetical protein
MKPICRLLPAATLAAALAPPPLAAQDAAHLCEEQAASAVIHIAICSEAAGDEVLAEEGRRICGEDLPCGTWFWLSAGDAPSDAPENHDGLTPDQVRSAMGVYVADDDMLVRITREGD